MVPLGRQVEGAHLRAVGGVHGGGIADPVAEGRQPVLGGEHRDAEVGGERRGHAVGAGRGLVPDATRDQADALGAGPQPLGRPPPQESPLRIVHRGDQVAVGRQRLQLDGQRGDGPADRRCLPALASSSAGPTGAACASVSSSWAHLRHDARITGLTTERFDAPRPRCGAGLPCQQAVRLSRQLDGTASLDEIAVHSTPQPARSFGASLRAGHAGIPHRAAPQRGRGQRAGGQTAPDPAAGVPGDAALPGGAAVPVSPSRGWRKVGLAALRPAERD